MNRLVQKTLPDPDGPENPLTAPETTWHYDAAGNVTSVVDPMENTTWYRYDALHRRTHVIDALDTGPEDPDHATITAYDAVGNVFTVTDPEQNTTTFEHDRLNRTISETNQLGHARAFEYDPAGNLVHKTDRNNRVTEYVYDSLGRRVEESWFENPGSEDPTFQMRNKYDAAGRLFAIEDSAATSWFIYDGSGNISSALTAPRDPSDSFVLSCGTPAQINPTKLLAGVESVDRLVQIERGTKVTASLSSEDFDAYLIVTSPSGRTMIDDNGGEGTDAYLEFIADEDGIWVFTVTSDDLPSEEDCWYTLGIGMETLSQVVEFDCGYDEAGNLRKVVDSSDLANLIGSIDATTKYTYDPLHRLTRIEQYGDETSNKQVDFVYNNAGQFHTIHRYASLGTDDLVASSQYSYDGIGRLTSLLHKDDTSPDPVTLAGYTWQYDAASRMTQMTSPDGTVDFTHDAVNQLTETESVQLPDENYSYDDNGNRLAVDGTEYNTTAGNRLASDGVFTYTYDYEGNRTARFVWTDGNQNGEVDPGEQSDVTEYTWDHRNRLTEVTDRATDSGPATQIVEYTYNSQNRRVCKAVDSDGNGTVNLYHYDIYLGDRPWLEITDPDGLNGLLSWQPPSLAHRYLWGPAVDQILAAEDPAGEVLWGLSDHQGTIRDIVNSTGTVVDHRQYNSFGKLTSNPAVDFIFGYTGKPLDPDTGLQYNHNRWYDATVGRWLSEDHIPDDTNPYRYVRNGPMTGVDPNGLEMMSSHPLPSEESTSFNTTIGSAVTIIRNWQNELPDFSPGDWLGDTGGDYALEADDWLGDEMSQVSSDPGWWDTGFDDKYYLPPVVVGPTSDLKTVVVIRDSSWSSLYLSVLGMVVAEHGYNVVEYVGPKEINDLAFEGLPSHTAGIILSGHGVSDTSCLLTDKVFAKLILGLPTKPEFIIASTCHSWDFMNSVTSILLDGDAARLQEGYMMSPNTLVITHEGYSWQWCNFRDDVILDDFLFSINSANSGVTGMEVIHYNPLADAMGTCWFVFWGETKLGDSIKGDEHIGKY